MLLPKSEPERGRWWDVEKKVVVDSIPNRFPDDYEPVGKVRERIKIELKKQLAAKSSEGKEHILEAFRHVADESDVAELEQIAKTDTTKRGKDYIVRDAAQKILNEMKAKKVENSKTRELQQSTTAQ